MEDLNFLELVFVAAALSTIITVPLFLIVLTITGLGRRWLAPWARQTLWSLVLVRLLLPVSFGSPASLQPTAIWLFESGSALLDSATPEPQSASMRPYNIDESKLWPDLAPSAETLTAGTVAPPPFDWFEFSISTVIPCVLLAGMFLFAFWTVITTVRLRRLVHAGMDCRREDWLALLAEGREEFHIRRTVTLRTLTALASPATCGVWRPAILLPEDAASWSTVELRHVVWHELAHIRRFDVATNWALAVVRMLHWWNPLFWYAQRAWLAEREMACDALVLRHLDGHQASEYGRTILRFLERLSAGHRGLPTSAAPGFVLFLGRKQAVQRRLAQLTQQPRRAPVWRRLLTGGLIAAVGLAGLSDAASPGNPARIPAPLPVRFELPAGTTWKILPSEETGDSEPLVERDYELAAVIAKLRQDEPQLTAEGAAVGVQQILRPLVGLPFDLPQSSPNFSSRSKSKVELAGDQLVVAATESQHAEIQKLLTLWKEHGQRQVVVRVRMATVPYSLKELLIGDGGQVWNSGSSGQPAQPPLMLDPDEPIAESRPYGIPVYTRVLSPQQTLAFEVAARRASTEVGGSLLFSPSVSSFEGVAAFIGDNVSRPFVTGVRTLDDGRKEPQISFVNDGFFLKLRSLIAADGETVRLAFAWRQSEITDVELLMTQSGTESIAVQIPQVSDMRASIEASVPAGHSLLVAPLRRNLQGQLLMFLATPRVLTTEDLQ